MASFLTTHASIGSSTFAQPDWDDLMNASIEGPSDFTANLHKYMNPETIPTTTPGSDHGSQLSVEGPCNFTARLLSYIEGRPLDTKDIPGEGARVRDPGMKAGGGGVVTDLDSAKLSDKHSDGPSNFTEELFKYMLSQSHGKAKSPEAVPATKYNANLDTSARDDSNANTPRQGMTNTVSADHSPKSENAPAAIPVIEHDTNLDIGGPSDFTMNMSHLLMMGTPFADHLTKLRPQDIATVASVAPQDRMASTEVLDRRILSVIKGPNITPPHLDSEKSVKARPILKPKSRKTSSKTSLTSGQLEMSLVPTRNRSSLESTMSLTLGHMDTSKVPRSIKSSTVPTVSQRNVSPIPSPTQSPINSTTPSPSKYLADSNRRVESQTRSPPIFHTANADVNLSERVVKPLQPTASNEASQLADEITMPFTLDMSDITEPLDSSTPITPRVSPHLVNQQDVLEEKNSPTPIAPLTRAPCAPQPDLAVENAMLRAQLEQMKAVLLRKDSQISSLKTVLKAKDNHCQAMREEYSSKIANVEAQIVASMKTHEEERRADEKEAAAAKERMKAALLQKDIQINSLKTALKAKDDHCQAVQEECSSKIKAQEMRRCADEQEAAAAARERMTAELQQKDSQINSLKTAIKAKNNHYQAVQEECFRQMKADENKRQADEQEAAAAKERAMRRLSAGLGLFAKKKKAAEIGERKAAAKVAELEVAAIAADEKTAAIAAKNEQQTGIIRALKMELEAVMASGRAAEADRKRREAILCGEVDRRGKALMIALGEKELPGVMDGRGRQGYRYVQRKAVVV